MKRGLIGISELLTSIVWSDSLVVAFREKRVEYVRDILTALRLPASKTIALLEPFRRPHHLGFEDNRTVFGPSFDPEPLNDRLANHNDMIHHRMRV